MPDGQRGWCDPHCPLGNLHGRDVPFIWHGWVQVAWTFVIVTFWFQVLAILLSFALPRISAIWLLVNIAISALIGIGFQVHLAYQPVHGI